MWELEPLICSLRAIGRGLQGFARACNSRISKPPYFLCPVLHRTAVPVVSEWWKRKSTRAHRFSGSTYK